MSGFHLNGSEPDMKLSLEKGWSMSGFCLNVVRLVWRLVPAVSLRGLDYV